ncbi:alpha/beta hydrolase-fold protein [Halobacillus salinarum]|uniref:Alpha/beta hydrolase-fold protein n=1 Tax=Halobacillus salinarum TaxID=2932257 RepID=A0ABY4EEL2_9BACI|nr:alpha/beta hydrolase-fold protein [Halobacillus salinarum]UOQ42586.1 alpha/beta hydrolase-fold protein [Halobacillus salinarum]
MEIRLIKSHEEKRKIDEWIVDEKEPDYSYRILVSQPKEPPPPSGYPVIYVLDGNAFFHLVEETNGLQSRRSDKTAVQAAIVIGIAYPGEKYFAPDRRFFDFTPPAVSNDLPPHPRGGEWPENGGADLFLNFIKNDLKPFLRNQYPICVSSQTLFGHSLGGLFTLYALFTNPGLFTNYIATSPSIWWNNQAVLSERHAFLEKLEKVNFKPRLFLSAGSEEKEYMVTDPKELAVDLQRAANSRLSVGFFEAEGENHLSVVPATISRSLRFTSGSDS